MNIENPYLGVSFLVSYVIAIICVFWLFGQSSNEALIASLLAITALGGASFAIFRHQRALMSESSQFQPSPLTPDSPILNSLMKGAIEVVCRGVSVPQTPESADLRAFIFQVRNNELVCSHYWSPNPTKEEVGITRFALDRELANEVSVVRAALDRQPCRTEINVNVQGMEGVSGEIDPDLTFVLAAPIFNPDGSVWGVVDFDSGNDVGKDLLKTTVSDTVMYILAEHLRLIFSLTEENESTGQASK